MVGIPISAESVAPITQDSKGFLSIKTADELAGFLEIDIKKLNFLLYKVKLKYTQFEIPKKSTGTRKISAPILPLKSIQNKLKKVLDEIYRPTRATHGYISSKSIATNAAKHTSRKYLLNIDLKDFFPSINFGRVYGLLKSYPFHFPEKVAMLLAQICTNDNQLPQGAPTSPILSNMICRKLDKDLIRLSKALKVQYTRYADDLSFSWDNKETIGKLVVSKNGITIASDQLKGIIEKNGFVINLNKIHAKTHLERQMVTGIIVNNEALNLPRTFPRNIRAMLHAWRKFGYESAGQEYQKKHQNKHRFPLSSEPSFSHVIKGKLNYMRMICGADHSTYLKLLTQFNQLSELINHETINSKLPDALWVIQNEDTCEQETAFFLEGFGVVTCAHVLEGGNEVYAFKANRPDDRYPVIQKAIDKDSDVALVAECNKPALSRASGGSVLSLPMRARFASGTES